MNSKLISVWTETTPSKGSRGGFTLYLFGFVKMNSGAFFFLVQFVGTDVRVVS